MNVIHKKLYGLAFSLLLAIRLLRFARFLGMLFSSSSHELMIEFDEKQHLILNIREQVVLPN